MPGIAPIPPYEMPAEHELPTNTATWKVHPARAVLLIHDMQRYFLAPFARGTEPGDSLLRNASALRARCAELGIPVAYTAQPGSMTADQRGLLRDFWGPGMSAGPADRTVVDEVAPAQHDRVFTKWRYSAFQRTELAEFLRETDRDQLIICGVYAHVGVLMTAVDAFSGDVQPFLVADAVADFTAADHRLALDYAARRCAVVASTRTVLQQLDVRPTVGVHAG